jgi:Galactose oxidase, central domain
MSLSCFRLQLFLLFVAALAQSNTSLLDAQTFSADSALPTLRQGHMATMLPNGTVLIAGGWVSLSEFSAGAVTSTALIYDPNAKTYTPTTGNMTAARTEHTATLLKNGMVLIAGGMGYIGGYLSNLSSAELYNPVTETFSATGSMAIARSFGPATLLLDGTVLMTGGTDGTPSNSAELYQPSTGTFVATGTMIAARDSHTATLLADGSVLIAGGQGSSAPLNSAEKYVPASKQFSPVGNMNSARSSHSATLLSDGTVLIAGGFGGSSALSTAEVYEPSTLSFTSVGPLHTARENQTATALKDGTVLTAGGVSWPSDTQLSSAEVYSPSSQTFATTGNMSTARDLDTATLLNDGTVLMVGGDTATSDLYSYPFTSGTMTPKYIVLGVLYSPPGAKSSVTYTQSTMVGTSGSFMQSLQEGTSESTTLGISDSNAPASGSVQGISVSGSLNGSVSKTWTQEADSSTTYTMNKTETAGIGVAGPLSSAIGVDHDYDTVLVWLNPQVDISAGAITTNLLWNGYAYNSNDTYFPNDLDVVYLSIFCLKNPFLSPDCTGSNYLTSRSWDTSGLGGLTLADYEAIAERDPFFSNPSYNPANDTTYRFTDTGQIVDYKPAPPGDGAITTPGSLVVQTTITDGQNATDTYQVAYSLDASLKAGGISGEFKDTNTLTWSSKWGATQTNQVGQTAAYSVTAPVATDNYAGPQSFEVWQDNVYGTFMFVAPGTTPTSPGSIGVSPSTITFSPPVAIGSTSSPVPVTLTNNSTMPMYMGLASAFPFTSTSTALSPVAAFSDPAFSVVSGSDNCTGKILTAGASCTLSLQFSPVASDVPGPDGAITAGAYFTAETDAVVLGNATLTGASTAATGGSGLQFIPVVPCRVADTRNASGPFGGPELTAGSSRSFAIPQSACNIPSGAVAYSLNITVVPNTTLGLLSVWPTGEALPGTSTLNSDGRVKADAVITPAGTTGSVSVYASDATQVILDINGYFVPAGTTSALAFYPIAACRVADTRNATGALGGPSLAANTSRAFPILSSDCGIPSTAQAYSLNVTAVPHSILNYLTTWPTGETEPISSLLNSSTGAVTANAAIVAAGTSGEVSIFASDATDVILDVNGYFAPPGTGGLSLYRATPCRVIDTRYGSGAFDGVFTVDVETSSCDMPSTAEAYVLNATVVPTGGLGLLTLWPTGDSQPSTSTLNASDGAVTSNMAIVPTINGSVSAYASNPTNLILDLTGYFAP